LESGSVWRSDSICPPTAVETRFAKMGVTAMAVGGVFGVAAKGTMNRLMKVSLRRGEIAARRNKCKVLGRKQH